MSPYRSCYRYERKTKEKISDGVKEDKTNKNNLTNQLYTMKWHDGHCLIYFVFSFWLAVVAFFFRINVLIWCVILLWSHVIMRQTRDTLILFGSYPSAGNCNCNQLLWHLNGRWNCLCRSYIAYDALFFIVCYFSLVVIHCSASTSSCRVECVAQSASTLKMIWHRKLITKCKCRGTNVWFCHRRGDVVMWAREMLIMQQYTRSSSILQLFTFNRLSQIKCKAFWGWRNIFLRQNAI